MGKWRAEGKAATRLAARHFVACGDATQQTRLHSTPKANGCAHCHRPSHLFISRFAENFPASGQPVACHGTVPIARPRLERVGTVWGTGYEVHGLSHSVCRLGSPPVLPYDSATFTLLQYAALTSNLWHGLPTPVTELYSAVACGHGGFSSHM